MKKILALMLSVLSLTLFMTGCGGSDTPDTTDSTKENSTQKTAKSEFAVGETWTVDGQWSFTINSIEETADRNEFSDKAPAAVYLVSFTYKNIGYEDENGIMDGLYFSMDDTVVDSAGNMGYSYPNDFTMPQETPIGASCTAQSCIGVDNAGTIKLYVTKYDGEGVKQEATFIVTP